MVSCLFAMKARIVFVIGGLTISLQSCFCLFQFIGVLKLALVSKSAKWRVIRGKFIGFLV